MKTWLRIAVVAAFLVEGVAFAQQADILGIAVHKAVSGVSTGCLLDRSILGEIVEPHDLMAGLEELFDDVSTDEPGRACDENLHVKSPNYGRPFP